MREIKETCYKGTRILVGNQRRNAINRAIQWLTQDGFDEVSIPVIQNRSIFKGKVGEENNNMMFGVVDRGGRDLCLAPEYTAIIQRLSKTTYKQESNVRLFYVGECFRGEKPQKGRYRQFTQLGVEILNPKGDMTEHLVELAVKIIVSLGMSRESLAIDYGVKRGLDYYKDGSGFEITCDKLGSAKQICGGGSYDGGIGFAIGVDRCLMWQNDGRESLKKKFLNRNT